MSRLSSLSFTFTRGLSLFTTETSLFPTSSDERPVSLHQGLELIRRLRAGRPAVHRDHGIGIFEGLAPKTINGQTRDYLILRYAEGDTLSVPVEFAHKVTAYIGAGQPPIHRLSKSTIWQKNRRQASADAAAFAQELLTTVSRRQAVHKQPYHLRPEAEEVLERTFPHELTTDQITAWTEVKQDLMSKKPADRLIIGDVGFGKTEIAIRAAYHAAAVGHQTAVIAPTTLLVQQHYDTFKKRLPQISEHIGLLSRFVSPPAQRHAIEKISSGELKIIIGTHALLTPRIRWQNLGLIIIDEEQRFGVKQKESLKKARASADVISLSATPIPRTLSMALTGLRDLSVIRTPPPGRQHVKTHVAAQSDTLIAHAIEQELKRQGQVYVVAHHIHKLPTLKRLISRLIPHAKTAIVHGQLEDNVLASLMHQFDSGAIDILISSTIIENGLDLPNANTLLVFEATRLGLSGGR